MISSNPELDSNYPDEIWRKMQSNKTFQPYLTEKSNNRPYDPSPTKSYTRVVCISDTHGKHRDIQLPRGDILIHGGDFTRSGEKSTISDLSQYFGELCQTHRFQKIVCIAGNHELTFDSKLYEKVHQRIHKFPMDCMVCRTALKNCIYLEDSSFTVNGLEMYGSPYTPSSFSDWAFKQTRGFESRQRWRKIPSSTDILITHGPPLGRGDEVPNIGKVGCVDLLLEVQERIQPRVHIFGHIHEGYGISSDGTTLFVNPSSVTRKYQPCNQCIVLDVPHDKSKQVIVVEPHSILSPDEVKAWFNSHYYIRQLVPYFSALKIPLSGEEIINSSFDEISIRLNITSKEKEKVLMRSISMFHANCFR